jgi:ABC-type multidrug transport system, ATPase component
MISLSGISKRYGSFYAVRELSFQAPKGEIIGLLGQNGAGKTTTLNILTGYAPPTVGTVTVGEFNMLENPRQAKRLIGYLPEKPPLYDEMTVESYLKFVCELKEVEKKAIPKHLDEIIQITGLKEMRKRRIQALSKGFRQRAGIAQALCAAPDILVLDEPTVGLDPRQVTEIRDLIRSLSKNHTIIFSSHILSEVQQLCSRVIILHQGQKVLEKQMDELGLAQNKQRLKVVIAMEKQKLMPALKGLECVEKVEYICAHDGSNEFILTVDRQTEPERRLFTLLCGLDAPLLYLAPVKDTLEETFLRVTEGGL